MNWLGNLFKGLFGGNKDDEERKRQQQQQQQQRQTKTQSTSQPRTQTQVPSFATVPEPFKRPDLQQAQTPEKPKQEQPQQPEFKQQVATRLLKKPDLVKPTLTPFTPSQQEMDRRKQAIATRREKTISSPSVEDFNKRDVWGQRQYLTDLETRRDSIAPTSAENVAEIDRLNQAIGTIQSGGARKAGSPATFVADMIQGAGEMIDKSGLKRLFNAPNIYSKDAGKINTIQDLQYVNEAYKRKEIDYDTLLDAFRNSPALFNPNVDYAISKEGGIENIRGDIGRRTAGFTGDTVSSGATVAQFMPYSMASKAATPLLRVGSRFLQGGAVNTAMNITENAFNQASNKSPEEQAQEATMSFLLGGAIEGVTGRNISSGAARKTAIARIKRADPQVPDKEVAKMADDMLGELHASGKINIKESAVKQAPEPATPRPSAIKSANPDFVPKADTPSPAQPQPTIPPRPLIPEVEMRPAGVVDELPTQKPVVEAPKVLDETRQLIEAEQLRPAPEPEVPVSRAEMTPHQAETARLAEQPRPVVDEPTLRAEQVKAQNEAATEAIARELDDAPSYARGMDDEYLRSADYNREQEFKRMAEETKSGDPYDHPDMYENPTPEMYDNLKPKAKAEPKLKTPEPEPVKSKAERVNLAKDEPAVEGAKAEPTEKRVSDIEKHTTQAREEIKSIREMFKDDQEVSAFLEKNYRKSLGEEVADYTPTEEKALSRMFEFTDESGKLIDRAFGLGDRGTILRRSDYVPFAKAGTAETPVSKADILHSELDFSKTRKGGLEADSKNFTPQAMEEAYMRERVTALGTKEFSPDEIISKRAEAIENSRLEMYEGSPDPAKQLEPIDMTPAERESIKESSKQLAKKELDHIDKTAKLEDGIKDGSLKGDKLEKASDEVVASFQELQTEQTKQMAKTLADFTKKAQAQIDKIDAELKTLRFKQGSKDLARKNELKTQRKSIYNRYEAIDAQAHYMQTTPSTNVLLQARGRIADTIQNVSEGIENKIFGKFGRSAMNKAYKKSTGFNLMDSTPDSTNIFNKLNKEKYFKSDYMKNYEFNKEYTKQMGNKIGDKYNTVGTLATEFASLNKAANENVVRMYVANGKRAGLSGEGLEAFVRSKVGTKEWNTLYNMEWNALNRHTGVAALGRNGGDAVEKFLSKSKKLTDGIAKSIPGLSLRQTRTVSKGLDIFMTSFSRASYRITKHTIQRATLGADSFVKASMIKGTAPADDLMRAMLMRQGVMDASVGGSFMVGGMSLGYMLGSNEQISGAYPEDKATRKRWEAEGITPYSIKMGDRWVNFSRYIPAAYLPIMMGGLLAQGKPEESTGALLEVIGGAYENTGLSGVVSTVSNLTEIAEGDFFGQGSKNLATSAITLATPLSGALAGVARGTDTSDRDTSGNFMESLIKGIQKKIPGLRNLLEKKTDSFGDVKPNDPLSSLFYTSKGGERTAVKDELSRLASSGVEAYPKGVQGANKDYQLKDASDKTIKLTSKDQLELNNAVKEEKAKQAELIMGSEAYKNASDTEKGKMLNSLYGLESSAVASEWAKSKGIEAKETAQKINNSLDKTHQQALIEYRLQGDKKKVWLEDNNNAANYYRANYENAKANGTLTKDDDNLQVKTGKLYKATVAELNKEHDVDYELQFLYKKTSKTEWRKMLTTDPERAQMLYEYDQLRTGKGVSDATYTDRPKYDQKKSSGSGRGRSGGKGGKFTYAQLPTGSSSTTSAGSYAKAKRLYQPVQALSTSKASAVTPGKKQISRKKGVHL